MKIGVLFFGVLKDVVGRSGETIDLPDLARVRDVLSYYAREAPRFEAMAPALAIAVNQEYAGAERELREGDEVGLLPPVSGGSAEGGEVRMNHGTKFGTKCGTKSGSCASVLMRRLWLRG